MVIYIWVECMVNGKSYELERLVGGDFHIQPGTQGIEIDWHTAWAISGGPER